MVLGLPTLSFAQGKEPQEQIDKFEYKKPMPEIALIPAEEFEANTNVHHVKPIKDEALEYAIRLPKNWEEKESVGDASELLLSNKMFGNVSRFESEANIDSPFPSQFTIQVIALEYELSAEQWFVQHLLSNGYALQGITVHDEDRAEALYITVERDVSYVIRSVAIRNGKRVILGRYKMPIERWEKEKSIQAQVIDSFRLANLKDEVVEKMKAYHFLDIAKFEYPESWKLRAPPFRSIDKLDVELLSIRHIPDEFGKGDLILSGKIGLSLVSVFVSDDINEEMRQFKSEYEKNGLIFNDEVKVEGDFDFSHYFTNTSVVAYNVMGKENDLVDYEFWITTMEYGDYYYFVTLLTPARKDDYYVWSRNTQTYALIVSTFKPQEDSLIMDNRMEEPEPDEN